MNIKDIDIERTFCLSSTLNFTRYIFKKKTGNRFIVGEHHRIICEALDKVINGEIKRLIINIAPRYGKTELAVKNFISYGMALNPKSKFTIFHTPMTWFWIAPKRLTALSALIIIKDCSLNP